MSVLLHTIQKNLGFQDLHKVDPNTQDVPVDNKTFGSHSVAQAAIPAILCAIYGHLETPKGIALILETDSSNWLATIFGGETGRLIQKIADYAKIPFSAAKPEIEHIANEAVRVVRDELPATPSHNDVYTFVATHKNETLLYLPASVQLGTLLHYDNLDDQTNKMEGPVSSFLHNIEKHFNSNENN